MLSVKDSPPSTFLLNTFYSKEILFPRTSWSVVLSCIVFVATSLLCSAFLEVTFFSPICSLQNILSIVFDPVKILLVVVLSTACLPATFVRLKSFSCSSSRKFQINSEAFWILLYFLVNLVTDILFLLSVLANLSYSLSLDARYVSYYLAVVSSVYLSSEYFYTRKFVLDFPDYVKPKFHLLTKNFDYILSYLIRSGWKVFIAIFFNYIIFGHYFVSALVETFLSDVWNVIYVTWLMVVSFIFIVCRRKFTEHIFNVWLCQPYKLEIPSPDVHKIMDIDHEAYVPSISDAMACDGLELLQYLAFWDFSRLTRIDKVRLHQVFLVSRPGGHPRPWNALRNECSRLLESFLSTLSDLNSKLALRWEVAFSLKDSSESSKMDILHKLDSKKTSLRDLEKLLAETDVFRHVQLLKWIIEGLGNILCAAYSEDRLGVIQIDLPKVLALFCDSFLQLEKFGRLSTTQYIDSSKRRIIDTSRADLKAELTKSLRCIKSTYGENLWSIDLKDEHRILLRSF